MSVASIVLCAGKGTRMKSRLPKVLHPVAGRPLGAFALLRAQQLGCAPVIAVVGHEAEEVERTLTAHLGEGLRYCIQAEQRGTGHAVQIGLEALQEDVDAVLILYGDSPLLREETLSQLLKAREEAGADLGLLTTRVDDATGYGRIVRSPDGSVARIVEHKDASPEERKLREINPGIYVVAAEFLRDGLSRLSTDNAQGELYLTDLVEMASVKGRVVDLEVDAEETLGVNDRRQLAESGTILRRRINERWMLAGVSMEDPDSTWIDDTVHLGQDVLLGPGVSLRRATIIADDVHIAQGSVLTDSTVERGARIHPYSVLEDAHMGPGSNAGPFARLRPAAKLEEGARVGNFVEVKKAVLGKGSKANHLAYIGDAQIGEGCNIGAGTITCNYDGFGKHLTELGDRVFIGSNSTLVAPVKINTDAYVGAGSTINREVPTDALAVSRAKQENKEGYAARIRARNKKRAGK
jgi:bifunctional UDP-N-acetylglucosamine pyrophosphorylase/glucosamine-1-phosphate N-acetyltransferase